MAVCCRAVTEEGFFYLPHDKPASAPLPCLPAGWSKAVSKGTGATYFLHTDGASQFEMPSEPAEGLNITELVTTPAQAGPKLPEGWKIGKTNDGIDPLFINTGAMRCPAKRIQMSRYGRALFGGGVGQ